MADQSFGTPLGYFSEAWLSTHIRFAVRSQHEPAANVAMLQEPLLQDVRIASEADENDVPWQNMIHRE